MKQMMQMIKQTRMSLSEGAAASRLCCYQKRNTKSSMTYLVNEK